MKSSILFLILFSQTTFAYTELQVACRVNGSSASKVSCGDKWVKMTSYPYIKIRLQSCLNFRGLQEIEINIDNVTYKIPKSEGFDFETTVEGFRIECTEL